MAEFYQIDFLKDPEICRLESEIHESRLATDRVRRGVFARLNELQKKYDDLIWEYETLKRAICRGEE